ncbi:hypothetical protein [Alterinioella nitratireducens]|uniref:hypothetical protein n=1 Tax=Alterinioella nitratireducens TaxID=2735915 RepID=UPI001555B5C9|nr:hypothetical protein [Alterinioella nitratireducens]NPD20521.1 hypothetical protein [Alterinioella nitratireducens]
MTRPPRDYLRLQWRAVRQRILRALVWVRRHVPPGLRLLLGLVLMAGGLLAFLPVFGLWMFPLGVAVAALDVKPLIRWFRARRD